MTNCGECDVSFPCHSGEQACIRLPQQEAVENTDMKRDPTWNGWILREVYFENGEPLGHRERPWSGLTDKEIAEAAKGVVEGTNMLPHSFANAIEAKLRSKNT